MAGLVLWLAYSAEGEVKTTLAELLAAERLCQPVENMYKWEMKYLQTKSVKNE